MDQANAVPNDENAAPDAQDNRPEPTSEAERGAAERHGSDDGGHEAAAADEPMAVAAEAEPKPSRPEAGAETSSEPDMADPFADAPDAEMSMDEGMSMMEMLMEEGDYFPESFERGDLVEGTVVSKDKTQIVLDIGAKQEAVVPASDLARLPEGYLDDVKVGGTLKGVIMRPDGEVVVSVFQAITVKDWEKASELLESGDILELDVVGFNKGGILVQFGHLQGFVPRSHIVRGQGQDGEARENVEELVGQHIPVKIIEVSRRKRRLIMSERQALREWRSTRKSKLLETLAEGEVRTGTVSSVADFGAFVDLGGADGLVHVSEMTFERGRHPRDLVKVGQEVSVYVLSIDRERSRIGLSMKRLQTDPWETVEHDHYVGELVEATISNLTKFGGFARLEDGLEGLIHISELADEHVEHPREAVRVGQRVTVEIISIDSARQRIGLSIRRVPSHLRTVDPEMPEAEDGSDADASATEAPPGANGDAAADVDTMDATASASADDDAGSGADAGTEDDASDAGAADAGDADADAVATEPVDDDAEAHDDDDDGDGAGAAPSVDADGADGDPDADPDAESTDADEAS